jgi:hypothetical protein
VLELQLVRFLKRHPMIDDIEERPRERDRQQGSTLICPLCVPPDEGGAAKTIATAVLAAHWSPLDDSLPAGRLRPWSAWRRRARSRNCR